MLKKRLCDQIWSSKFQSLSLDLTSAFQLHNYQKVQENHKTSLQILTSGSLSHWVTFQRWNKKIASTKSLPAGAKISASLVLGHHMCWRKIRLGLRRFFVGEPVTTERNHRGHPAGATEHSARLQLAPSRLSAKRGSKTRYQQGELCYCQVTLRASKLTCCPAFHRIKSRYDFNIFIKQNNGLDVY